MPRLGVLVPIFLALAACREPLGPADVGGLDDDFAGEKVAEAWTLLRPETFEHRVAGGRLLMKPIRNTVWYKADQGPALVKLVTGNFRVSARVRARKASDGAAMVDSGFQFGGLIARDPASDAPSAKEAYVFNVVGYRGDSLCVETKTTKRDHSVVEAPPWPTADAELRICRLSEDFRLYKRPIDGGPWQHAITYARSDLPPTLQVGPIAYAYTDQFDLEASFEEVRFAAVSGVEDCTSD